MSMSGHFMSKIEPVKITGTAQLEVISPAGQPLPQRCLGYWQPEKGQDSNLKWIYNLPVLITSFSSLVESQLQ